jgi:tRNA dimethylallyltransferase
LAGIFEKMIIPVIIGPTCIGKTSLALEVAKETGSDILSIDSRQVFRYLDIGTGKYKETQSIIKSSGNWEINGVKIWGYDVLNPNQELTVLKYCDFARQIIENYQKSSKRLIATCGTGFYLDFLSGKVGFNEIDPIRKKELHFKNINELKQILISLNPDVSVDWENKLRVITKILTLESAQPKINFKINEVEFKNLYLTAPRETLYKNADKFTEAILKNGVIEEYQRVLKEHGTSRALEGLIYKNIKDYIEEKILFEEMELQIKFSLHAYIRRQQTYFKKMNIYFTSEDRKDLAEKIKELL